jgi:hypothetical protein
MPGELAPVRIERANDAVIDQEQVDMVESAVEIGTEPKRGGAAQRPSQIAVAVLNGLYIGPGDTMRRLDHIRYLILAG